VTKLRFVYIDDVITQARLQGRNGSSCKVNVNSHKIMLQLLYWRQRVTNWFKIEVLLPVGIIGIRDSYDTNACVLLRMKIIHNGMTGKMPVCVRKTAKSSYNKTCLKRNAIVPVFFFSFYKGLCLMKKVQKIWSL